jgi:hypothetical protein
MRIEGAALLVFGSRTLDDQRVDELIDDVVRRGGYKYIVTALDPAGVCERVKHYVKTSRTGLILIQVALDAARAAGMHEVRSITALKLADHMLAIWDGRSKGTSNEIKLARKMRVPVTIKRLQPRHESGVLLESVDKMIWDWTL